MASAISIAILITLGAFSLAALFLYRSFSGGGSGRLGRVGKYDPKTGIGRGAPGFQTSISRIAVPAHIVARIRAGEDVSPEEITAAQAEAAALAEAEADLASHKQGGAGAASARKGQGKGKSAGSTPGTPVPLNEWLPEGLAGAAGGGGGGARSRRGGRRSGRAG